MRPTLRLILVLVVLLSCSDEQVPKALETPSVQLPEYTSILLNIQIKRQDLATRYEQSLSTSDKTKVLEEAREFLVRSVCHDILPQWLGTPWDFNGTTETPNEGKIACGYFVSTVIKDAGFKVQRTRLGQQASELIIKSLTTEKHIKRYSDVSIEDFISSIRNWGPGLYIVGLDLHTGFILSDDEGVSFVHSSYLFPSEVVKEDALISPILFSSRYRVLGKIFDDDTLLICWLKGNTIRTKTS